MCPTAELEQAFKLVKTTGSRQQNTQYMQNNYHAAVLEADYMQVKRHLSSNAETNIWTYVQG